MLSHANIMSQLRNFHTLIDVRPGDTTLSLLPPWHIYERTTGYFVFQQGACQVLDCGLSESELDCLRSTNGMTNRRCTSMPYAVYHCTFGFNITRARYIAVLQVYSTIKKFRCQPQLELQTASGIHELFAMHATYHSLAASSMPVDVI